MIHHQFIWFDCETTGLDEHAPGAQMLEWALILAADDRDGDMSPVQEFTGVIHCPKPPPESCDLYVVGMHTKNGLWEDCAKSDTTAEETDDFLYSLLQIETGQDRPKDLTLAGSSINFDLRWCKKFLPKFASALSYRVFDVSTLWRAVESWAPEGRSIALVGDATHRALDDIRRSLAIARQARTLMGWGK